MSNNDSLQTLRLQLADDIVGFARRAGMSSADIEPWACSDPQVKAAWDQLAAPENISSLEECLAQESIDSTQAACLRKALAEAKETQVAREAISALVADRQAQRKLPEVGFLITSLKTRPVGEGCIACGILLDDFIAERLPVAPITVRLPENSGQTYAIEVRTSTGEGAGSAYDTALKKWVNLFDHEVNTTDIKQYAVELAGNARELVIPHHFLLKRTPFFLVCTDLSQSLALHLKVRLLFERLTDCPDFIGYEARFSNQPIHSFDAKIIARAKELKPEAGFLIPFSTPRGDRGVLELTEPVNSTEWRAMAYLLGSPLKKGMILERKSEGCTHVSSIPLPIAEIIEVGENAELPI